MADRSGEMPQRHGGVLRPFPPDVSGNPGGRPKGMMARVQGSCGRDRKKLVDALLAIAFGTDEQLEKVFHRKNLEVTDRLRAVELLADRGWGRPSVLEDDMPFVPATGTGGGVTLEFHILRPPKELEGRTTVYDDETEPTL
jgi:hypothetical protein